MLRPRRDGTAACRRRPSSARLTCTGGGRTLTIIVVAARQTSRTRAKDTDRRDTCQVLDTALADGQLSMEEHRDRIAAATHARTLGQLAALTADLQIDGPPTSAQPRLPRSRVWLLMAAAASGLVAVAVAAAVIVSGDHGSPTSDHEVVTAAPEAESPVAPTLSAEPDRAPDEVAPTVLNMPRELHTVAGLTGLLDQIRSRFGDTIGYELAVTRDEAYLLRADPTDDRSKLLYRFDNGWGDPSRRPRDDGDNTGDLSAFDVPAAVRELQSAPATLGISPDDVSEVYLDIDELAQQPTTPSGLELLIKVTGRSTGDGYIYLDSAGNTKRVELPS
jgi:hypothetical protein